MSAAKARLGSSCIRPAGVKLGPQRWAPVFVLFFLLISRAAAQSSRQLGRRHSIGSRVLAQAGEQCSEPLLTGVDSKQGQTIVLAGGDCRTLASGDTQISVQGITITISGPNTASPLPVVDLQSIASHVHLGPASAIHFKGVQLNDVLLGAAPARTVNGQLSPQLSPSCPGCTLLPLAFSTNSTVAGGGTPGVELEASTLVLLSCKTLQDYKDVIRRNKTAFPWQLMTLASTQLEPVWNVGTHPSFNVEGVFITSWSGGIPALNVKYTNTWLICNRPAAAAVTAFVSNRRELNLAMAFTVSEYTDTAPSVAVKLNSQLNSFSNWTQLHSVANQLTFQSAAVPTSPMFIDLAQRVGGFTNTTTAAAQVALQGPLTLGNGCVWPLVLPTTNPSLPPDYVALASWLWKSAFLSGDDTYSNQLLLNQVTLEVGDKELQVLHYWALAYSSNLDVLKSVAQDLSQGDDSLQLSVQSAERTSLLLQNLTTNFVTATGLNITGHSPNSLLPGDTQDVMTPCTPIPFPGRLPSGAPLAWASSASDLSHALQNISNPVQGLYIGGYLPVVVVDQQLKWPSTVLSVTNDNGIIISGPSAPLSVPAGGNPTAAVLDMGASSSVLTLAAGAVLYIQRVTLTNLVSKPLDDVVGVQKALPLSSSIPLWAFSVNRVVPTTGTIQLDSVTLVLPNNDYALMMYAAQRGEAWKSQASTNNRLIQGSTTFSVAPGSQPSTSSVLLSQYRGWSISASNLLLLPANPVASFPTESAIIGEAGPPAPPPPPADVGNGGSSSSSPTASLDIGPVVGGVVAGVIGLILILVAALWITRTKRSKANNKDGSNRDSGGAAKGANDGGGEGGGHSTSTDSASPGATGTVDYTEQYDVVVNVSSWLNEQPSTTNTTSIQTHRTAESQHAARVESTAATGVISSGTHHQHQQEPQHLSQHDTQHTDSLLHTIDSNGSMVWNGSNDVVNNSSVAAQAGTPSSSSNNNNDSEGHIMPRASSSSIRAQRRGDLFHRDVAPLYHWVHRPQECLAVEDGLDASVDMHNGAVMRLDAAGVQNSIELVEDGLLGMGATAVVYECMWPARFGKTGLLAAKVLKDTKDRSGLASFAHEVRVLEQVRHCNVVRMYGYCLEPPYAVIIMELLGLSLRDTLYSQGTLQTAGMPRPLPFRAPWPLKAGEVLAVARDLAQGLAHLHARSVHGKLIVHHDLKPPNALVNSAGRIKLSDFGLARENSSTNTIQTAHEGAGTLRYMAPEVLADSWPTFFKDLAHHKLTAKVDIYSLGIIMWELVAKELPWRGTMDMLVPFKVAAGVRLPFEISRLTTQSTMCPISGTIATGTAGQSPAGLPADFEGMPAYQALIERCWQLQPELRPTAAEVVQELSAMIASFDGC